LKEEITQRDGIHSALLSFQKEKTAAGLGAKLAKASKDGPSYAYTDLKTTLQAVQFGSAFGLVHHVSFHPIGETTIMVRLTITHTPTGEDISSEMPVSTEYQGVRNQSQAFGSAVTYAKKYLYWGLYGLANADDDGEATSNQSDKGEAHKRGNNTSPLTHSIPPKDADVQRRNAIHNDLQAIYKKDNQGAIKIIDLFTDANDIEKGKFNIVQVKTHEQILFLQKEISKYKLDKQKNY
tara:strand:+ start:1640 stop:2350 length:711 start_codon:yes stop_codon:yes gene_type:complete